MVWLIASAAVLAVLLLALARRQMKNPHALDGEVEAGPALVGGFVAATAVIVWLALVAAFLWLGGFEALP